MKGKLKVELLLGLLVTNPMLFLSGPLHARQNKAVAFKQALAGDYRNAGRQLREPE
jgi:hypothetical protein